MILIALETSSSSAGLAVTEGKAILVESSLQMGSVYAEQLPVMLERGLKDAGLKISQIGGIAISIGPGSYTGLRVGLSLAKGLAFSTGKPLVAVPTLDAVAFGSPYCPYPIHAILDARHQKIYTAEFDMSQGNLQRKSRDIATTVDKLSENINGPALLLGPGALTYGEQLRANLGERAHFTSSGSDLRASSIAALGLEYLERGEQASLYEIEPTYLRKPNFKRRSAQPDTGVLPNVP
ncbi:MAG: tRNA (adenosine(37)-N6)-threonylcarbamoyltransferase complex dimerization subunit type 1 TsaB [Candidatus Latescibacteria bacterium]|nr:tRNA (adenosine(37)-N6)-threonylcarbamoyltransferase complex dimerization subunit type 1 TsaB [Candidatus Latescibacterota bacterium]